MEKDDNKNEISKKLLTIKDAKEDEIMRIKMYLGGQLNEIARRYKGERVDWEKKMMKLEEEKKIMNARLVI